MTTEYSKIKESADFILSKIGVRPAIGVILGSGLGKVLSSVNKVEIPFSQIPWFASPGVEGHKGVLCAGTVRGQDVIVLRGRIHYYEGFDISEVVFPVRVLSVAGVRYLIITNAAGSLVERLKPGDLMIISDHINLIGVNPLRGKNIEELGERFPNMSRAYDKDLITLIRQIDPAIPSGIYAAMPGPSYETMAEVEMLRRLGADVVGMSTVPETIAAVHCGMKVLGISCIANTFAETDRKPISHKDVVKALDAMQPRLSHLLEEIIEGISIWRKE